MTLLQSCEQDCEKRAAAARAVEEVEDGMVLGLVSGSAAAFAVEAVAARVAKGLRVVAIPSSEATAALARQIGVPLTSFVKHRRIDVTIDGADLRAQRSEHRDSSEYATPIAERSINVS